MSENGVSYNTELYNPGNSFKAIVTGDWHFRGTNPRSRLDNFQDSLEEKLMEVMQLAHKHKADCIICPGDIFDGPAASWGTVARLARVLESAPCKVLTVSGNHDIFGGNKSSKPRTPYGFLVQTGYLWDVEESAFLANGVRVTGCGFDTDTDTNTHASQMQYFPELLNTNVARIHVVHSMLMDRPPGFDMRHTLISEVETGAHVIVSGHEHTGFGVVRRDGDGVLFVNPGALCRLSAHVAEIERTVQVVLLTVDGGGAGGADHHRNINAELIPLKSAQPGHEVLSREHLEAAHEREARIGEFLKLLASEGEGRFLEVRDIVEDIAVREALPDAVKQDALRRIGAAREALGVVGTAGGDSS